MIATKPYPDRYPKPMKNIQSLICVAKKMSTVFSTEDILQAWTGLANTYLYIKPMYKFTQYMYMYVDYKESKSTHSVSRSITVRLYAEPD